MRRPPAWRIATAAGFAAAGVLGVTTWHDSGGLDLRAASVTDLATVVRQERAHADDLHRQIGDLEQQIHRDDLRSGDRTTRRLRARVDAVRGPAGGTPVSGPGVTVTLRDTPREEASQYLAEDAGLSPDALVVHQQDIQAVVNALWQGGATAVTVQNQRIITTTGIKCVGNTVVLHGVPYAPPYRISAVGDRDRLLASLRSSDYVRAYQQYVTRYDLGWQQSPAQRLDLPAYTGSTDLMYARPVAPRRSGRG